MRRRLEERQAELTRTMLALGARGQTADTAVDKAVSVQLPVPVDYPADEQPRGRDRWWDL